LNENETIEPNRGNSWASQHKTLTVLRELSMISPNGALVFGMKMTVFAKHYLP
jgi:hypothetical protein